MKTSNEINEIAKAMSLAQSQMKVAEMDSTNPHFRSRYANLESVIDAFRKPICDNSLTYWQDVVTQEGYVSVTTRIAHSSGQWVEFGPLSIPLGKKDAHGIGSATTYAKRYALCAAMGVAPGEIDDDGNAAVEAVKSDKANGKSVTHQAIEKKEESEQEIPIEQIKKLHTLSDKCDKEYLSNIYGYLKSKGVDGFDGIKTLKLLAQITQGMESHVNNKG